MRLSAQSKINWKKTDYLTLGKAVANYNKKINKLNSEERKLYLPELLNYKEVKQGITTRRELNRILKSLQRFNRKGAEDLYVTEAGEQITKWERNELSIQKSIAKRRLNQELEQLNIPDVSGFSRVQMGSEEQRTILRQLENLETIENKKGYEFTRLTNRIKKIGTSDYTVKMSIVYQENFMEQLEDLKDTMPEFEKLYNYLATIKNPITFYNKVQSIQGLNDFFEWYKTPEDYGNFGSVDEMAEFYFDKLKEGE